MFINNICEYKFKNQSAIIKADSFLWKEFHKLKPIVSRDEYEDLKQDIILTVIEADNSYDPKYETSFLTHLGYQMRAIEDDLITRYTGIKLWKGSKALIEKQTGEKVYINITNFKEEV